MSDVAPYTVIIQNDVPDTLLISSDTSGPRGIQGPQGVPGSVPITGGPGYLYGSAASAVAIAAIPYTDIAGLTPYNLYVYTKAEVDSLISHAGATLYSEPVVLGGSPSDVLFDDSGDIIMTFVPIPV